MTERFKAAALKVVATPHRADEHLIGERTKPWGGQSCGRACVQPQRKQTGQPLTGHTDRVWSAAFSPDGKRIVRACE